MKLVEPKSTFNFYESFSDLIFCSLVLFLVLILFLALLLDNGMRAVEAQTNELSEAKKLAQAKESELVQLQLAVRDKSDELTALIGSNRFTGVFGRTRLSYAVDNRIESNPRFVLLPAWLVAEASSTPVGVSTEAHLLEIRKKWSEIYPSLHILGRMEFAAILNSMSRYYPNVTDATGIPESIGGNTRTDFSLMLSGDLQANGEFSPGAYKNDRQIAKRFEQLQEMAELETVEEYRNRGKALLQPRTSAQNMPVLFFDVTEDRQVVLDGVRFKPAVVLQLLQAIGGAGVIIEFQRSEAIPDWFINEVMVPTGYVNRVPAADITAER